MPTCSAVQKEKSLIKLKFFLKTPDNLTKHLSNNNPWISSLVLLGSEALVESV